MGKDGGNSGSKSSEIQSVIVNGDELRQTKNDAASAHVTDNGSLETPLFRSNVGLMLVTGFNNGWIMSYSLFILVPLGWSWGIFSLIAVGVFTAYANWLLASFHFIEGHRFIRYRDLMGFLFGKKMYYLTWFYQFSTLLLTNMGFILLGGMALKEINMVFSGSTLRLQYFIIITGAAYCSFSIVVPNMSAVGIWLVASAILTVTFISFLSAVSIKDGLSNKDQDYQIVGSKADKVFNALGAISAIIVTNTSGMLMEIQSTLRKPAVKNMRRALFMHYTSGLMLYYGVCIIGYWAYGTQVTQYLPQQLSGPKWAKVLINGVVFLQNIISQHCFVQPVHETLDTKFLNLEESVYSRKNIMRRFILRIMVFTGNTLVVAAIPFMGDFINLSGSVSLIPLTFIFPSIIFLKVKGKTAKPGNKAWHWIIIFAFTILAVATTTSAIRLIVKNIKQYHFFADA